MCPYCGQSSQTVFVHGHEQCVVCKTNVEPCCSGQGLEVGGDEKWFLWIGVLELISNIVFET